MSPYMSGEDRIAVVVNGEPTSVPAATTVGDVVSTVSATAAGVAVALNGAVVPRSSWPAEALKDGDRVEILTAAQGG